MLLYTFLSRDDLDIIHCLPETLPVENVVDLCAVVAGTVGNQVGHSLSEAGISHNQVVCQGKLQQYKASKKFQIYESIYQSKNNKESNIFCELKFHYYETISLQPYQV